MARKRDMQKVVTAALSEKYLILENAAFNIDAAARVSDSELKAANELIDNAENGLTDAVVELLRLEYQNGYNACKAKHGMR